MNQESIPQADHPSVLEPWLRLVRLPAVFTAMADVFAGFLLTHSSFAPIADFVWLLVASSCLYLCGMAFNDVFDRRVDIEQRPHRPIPSGQVSLRGAVILGIVLAVAGNAATLMVGGHSTQFALFLTIAIFAYDALLKKTPLGPVAMGACRFFNVMLGASMTAPHNLWHRPHIQVAAGLGIYVIGLTWFARRETGTSSRGQLIAASFVVNLGLGALAQLIVNWPGAVPINQVLFVFCVITLVINRRLASAIMNPEPTVVGSAIKTMLLSVVLLDATMVFFKSGNSLYALATAALLIPSFALARWIDVT